MPISIARRRRVSAVLVTVGLLLVAVQPVQAGFPTWFGADLSGLPFPSNSYEGQNCQHEISGDDGLTKCTWIMAYAYDNNGATGAMAPKNGYINEIRLIAGEGGSFKLFIAKYNQTTHTGKVVRRGPVITYATDLCDLDCAIQEFPIAPLRVRAGQYLAVKMIEGSFLRCDSGGNRIGLFTPPLKPGNPPVVQTDSSGCFMLLQAIYTS